MRKTPKPAPDDGLKSCAGCNHYHGSWAEVERCEASAEASNVDWRPWV